MQSIQSILFVALKMQKYCMQAKSSNTKAGSQHKFCFSETCYIELCQPYLQLTSIFNPYRFFFFFFFEAVCFSMISTPSKMLSCDGQISLLNCTPFLPTENPPINVNKSLILCLSPEPRFSLKSKGNQQLRNQNHLKHPLFVEHTVTFKGWR